jgi:DNA primase
MDERFVLDRVREHAGQDRQAGQRQVQPGGQDSAGRRSGTGPGGPPRPGRDTRANGSNAAPGPNGAAGPNRGAGPNGGGGPNGEAGRNGAAVPGWQGAATGAGGVSYDPRDPVVRVEREALKLAVQRPGLCGPEFAALGADAFTVPAHAGIFRLICERAGWGSASQPPVPAVPAAQTGQEWARNLREAAPDEQARALVTQLAVETLRTPGADGEPDARYVSAVLARVEELAVSRQITGVKSRLQRMDPVAAQAEYNRLFGDLIGLEQRRKVLIDRASGAL